MSASCSSRVRLEVSTTIGGVAALMVPSSGIVTCHVREHLEQEGLELVVGAVDLVDEQDARGLAQRLEHRAGEEEALVEELGLERAWRVVVLVAASSASTVRRCRIWRGKSQS